MLPHSLAFDAIGTKWEISSEYELPDDLQARIYATIDEFDRTYSRFRPDSLISRIAAKAGRYEFPKNAAALFEFYKTLYELTDGKVTPLIGDMLVRAGYDADYSFVPHTQKDLEGWDEVMRWKGTTLHTKRPITLDVGAAGKGYLVDIVASLLDEHATDEYVIDASGDLRHKGISENIVGLEHPANPGMVIGRIDVQNQSLCASASNRRVWGDDVHHIFNPNTKSPVRDVIATWVIADETIIADGLATALFFTEPHRLNQVYAFQYVRMHNDGSLDYSHNFTGELF